MTRRKTVLRAPAAYLDSAAAEAGCPVEAILRPCRRRSFVAARWRAMAAAYADGYSLMAIARTFDRDHTSVLHAVKRMGVWDGAAVRTGGRVAA